MAPRTQYQDAVAIVTGASSGIGEALTLALAARGAQVALVARRKDRLDTLAAQIEKRGGRARGYSCDLSERGAIAQLIAQIASDFGRIDLLINNAGHARHALFADEDPDEIERLMRTNYFAPVELIRQVLPHFRERGTIVNVSSFAGKVGQPDEAAYSASKAALSALSEALVHELAPRGIHVLCVHPVLIRTEMFTDDVMARMPSAIEKRFIKPDELAAEVLRALDRGETDITVPRSYSGIYLLRSLFPKMMRDKMGRVKMARLLERK